MKIGYFGSPEIAVYCLERLLSLHEISFVVTGEDKPAGRNRYLDSTPVKKIALDKSIPVLQPSDLKEKSFIEELKRRGADIYVVVAYGKIIPAPVFSLPEYKTINLHPSLLPLYRGAAPIPWALMNGERETGVTIQQMNERLDAGGIILQERIGIETDMTAGDLFNAILPQGAALLLESLELICAGKAASAPQDETKATYCGKIGRETARIEWGRSAFDVHNLARALNPKPCAWTTYKGKNIKILRTHTAESEPDHELNPGTIAVFEKNRLIAGTGDGIIEILEIQPESKKPMSAGSFINGYRIADGDIFGS